jgi:DNA-binding transcriptional MocR family regulator
MTPAEEATFIQLWQQGLPMDAIAQQLSIPRGTVSSRAERLAAQGKIEPRPRGGAYPRQHSLAQQGDPPARAPAPAASSVATRDTPAITMVAVPELRELINHFSTLEARVAALENGTRGTTRDPPAGRHQTVDRPTLPGPHRRREGPGGRGGQGTQPCGRGIVVAGVSHPGGFHA